MIIYLWQYDKNIGKFVKTTAIDYASSVIWVTRYNECGEFEICLPASKNLFKLISGGEVMFTRDDRESAMLIEKIQLTTDEESGDTLILSGRSIESILARRVVRKQTLIYGTAESGIRQLLNENIIAPNESERKVELLEISNNTDQWNDGLIKQITGDNLLDAISDICKIFDYGFKITNEESHFLFSLYKGSDVTSTVIFSSKFGNLANTEFTTDYKNSANSVYIAGEGEGSERKIVVYEADEYETEGLFRKEYWYDRRDCSSTTNSGQTVDATYQGELSSEGRTYYYSTLRPTTDYTAEVINNYEYGVDFNLGDTVRIVNDYGITATAVVTEITETEDANGYSLIPTLSDWTVI